MKIVEDIPANIDFHAFLTRNGQWKFRICWFDLEEKKEVSIFGEEKPYIDQAWNSAFRQFVLYDLKKESNAKKSKTESC